MPCGTAILPPGRFGDLNAAATLELLAKASGLRGRCQVARRWHPSQHSRPSTPPVSAWWRRKLVTYACFPAASPTRGQFLRKMQLLLDQRPSSKLGPTGLLHDGRAVCEADIDAALASFSRASADATECRQYKTHIWCGRSPYPHRPGPAERLYFSGKHQGNEMNMRVITGPNWTIP